MIKRLQVWIPAEAAREFSSQESTLCTDSYSMSVPPLCYHWGMWKTPVILPKVQVADYTQTRIHPWPNKVGDGWLCRCPGIAWEPIRTWSHKQLVREHLVTVISARWATVDWSWPKEWKWCAHANLHLKKKKSADGEWIVQQSPKILACEETATFHTDSLPSRLPSKPTF